MVLVSHGIDSQQQQKSFEGRKETYVPVMNASSCFAFRPDGPPNHGDTLNIS
jgi:hypothetical protein